VQTETHAVCQAAAVVSLNMNMAKNGRGYCEKRWTRLYTCRKSRSWCSSCFGKMLQIFHADVAKVNIDVVMLHTCPAHVVTMLSECCIFHRDIWRFNQHETYVLIGFHLIFRWIVLNIFNIFFYVANIDLRCCGCWVSVLQTTFLDVANVQSPPSER
jgi:hypothetical protein